jgi:manganese/iron transport system permease protein
VRGLLVEPFAAPFMARALVAMVLVSVLAGIVGVHVALRRLTFAADATTHTVFPGVAIAFFLGRSVFVGALVAAAVSAVVLTVATRNRRIDQDAFLAVLVASAFSLGVVVVSRQRTFASDLTALLFGRPLTVDRTAIVQTAVLLALVLATLAVCGKELVLRAFDPAAAEAMGYRAGWLDLVVNVMVALVVVASARVVGTALAVALLITPAAIGQVVGQRIGVQVTVAVAAGILCSWVGLGVSAVASIDHGLALPPGGVIVVLLTVAFLVVTAVSALARVLRRRRPATLEAEAPA